MKTTRYFDEQVRRKRPYVDLINLENVIAHPLRREVQDDGRTRLWAEVTLPDEAASRILRVVLLDDGETVHNAFLDRNFR